ncbi:hypothetical protein E2562_000082 [Oryza meyeriana var. granulata]|uniref:DUF1618 domain-containing protein n=1 Tax=Oryza meyeriana var. granulata TaxID=110450 RepID=A0A6G1DBG7_9ORYZ|nr:hypothetical protein E2562_000082 [Oryza meyeriana var. granulata]
MLWWVDLSYGLLACDPFAEEPNLLHVLLPQVPDELPVDDRLNHGAHRCARRIDLVEPPAQRALGLGVD